MTFPHGIENTQSRQWYFEREADQELAGRHVIHGPQHPATLVHVQHAHFTVPHCPRTSLLVWEQVPVRQGEPAATSDLNDSVEQGNAVEEVVISGAADFGL